MLFRSGSAYFFLYLCICLYILRRRNELSFAEKGKKLAKFFLPAFGICFFYHLYKFFMLDDYRQWQPGATDNLNFLTVKMGLGGDYWTRIPAFITRLCENLFLMGNWSIIWVIFFLSLFCFAKYKNSGEIKILNFAVILFFSLLFFVFVFTQYFKWIAFGHEPLSRTTLHFFPLIPLLISLIHAPRK